jgi:hypothetical protein
VSTITDSVGARNELQRIVPAGVIAYVDKIHVWLKTPRPRTEVAWLRAAGASPKEADSWVDHLRNDSHENYTPISFWERLIRNFSPNVRRG